MSERWRDIYDSWKLESPDDEAERLGWTLSEDETVEQEEEESA